MDLEVFDVADSYQKSETRAANKITLAHHARYVDVVLEKRFSMYD